MPAMKRPAAAAAAPASPPARRARATGNTSKAPVQPHQPATRATRAVPVQPAAAEPRNPIHPVQLGQSVPVPTQALQPVPTQSVVNEATLREACRAAAAESAAKQLEDALAKAEARCRESDKRATEALDKAEVRCKGAERRATEAEQRAAQERERILQQLPSMVYSIASAMAPASFAPAGDFRQPLRSPVTIKLEPLDDRPNADNARRVPETRTVRPTALRAGECDEEGPSACAAASQAASQASIAASQVDEARESPLDAEAAGCGESLVAVHGCISSDRFASGKCKTPSCTFCWPLDIQEKDASLQRVAKQSHADAEEMVVRIQATSQSTPRKVKSAGTMDSLMRVISGRGRA